MDRNSNSKQNFLTSAQAPENNNNLHNNYLDNSQQSAPGDSFKKNHQDDTATTLTEKDIYNLPNETLLISAQQKKLSFTGYDSQLFTSYSENASANIYEPGLAQKFYYGSEFTYRLFVNKIPIAVLPKFENEWVKTYVSGFLNALGGIILLDCEQYELQDRTGKTIRILGKNYQPKDKLNLQVEGIKKLLESFGQQVIIHQVPVITKQKNTKVVIRLIVKPDDYNKIHTITQLKKECVYLWQNYQIKRLNSEEAATFKCWKQATFCLQHLPQREQILFRLPTNIFMYHHDILCRS